MDRQSGWIMDSNQTNQLDLDFDEITINLTDTMLTSSSGQSMTYTLDHTSLFPNGHPAITINPNWNNNTAPSWTFSESDLTSPNSGKISLKGENADIEINGESVVGMLREIRDRLNILQVSEEMEKEWDELRELREQYEAKLAECREKSQMWSTLKKMPPPEIL